MTLKEHYQPKDKADNKRKVYVKCVKGMYGLPHAGIISQKLLEERLNEADDYQSDQTPGFWKHKWRPMCFSLIGDNFGVKYERKEEEEHLLRTLKKDYTVTDDWKGE